MNSDALMLGLIAIADIYLIVYLRRRRMRRVRLDQMTASLRLAIHQENQKEAMPARPLGSERFGRTAPGLS